MTSSAFDDADSRKLIADLPSGCASCSRLLCLRQQVINLALGSSDRLLCLACLAAQYGRPAASLLSGLRAYILGRECFAGQWRKYESAADCPSPRDCIPETCFLEGACGQEGGG